MGHIVAVGSLTTEQVRDVLGAATAAPSWHNSQPWRFRCTPAAIELHAARDLAVPIADPDHRELLLACGAALGNLRLAIRALGVYPAVQLLPTPDQPDLLAVVRPQGRRPPTPVDQRLAAAIPRRRTNRRPFLPSPVPAGVRAEFRRAAEVERAWLAVLAPAQLPMLRALLQRAYQARQQDSEFVAKDFEPEPLIAVIGSCHDQPLARLQAGQAMQRVLLTATAAGLAASFLSQVVDVAPTRTQLRALLGGGVWPQVVLRIGHGAPVPATSRRPLDDVVDEPDRDDVLAGALRG